MADERSVRLSRSVSEQVKDDLSAVGAGTVLEQIDALPGAEHKFAVHQRYGKLHLRQSCFEVSGHVIRAFGIVSVGSRLRRDAVEIGLQIDAYGGIGVLLDEKRCRRMATENREKTSLHRLLPNPLADGRGAVIQTLTTRCNFKKMPSLLQKTSPLLLVQILTGKAQDCQQQ